MKGEKTPKTLILNGTGYIIKSHVFVGSRSERTDDILE